MPAHNIVQISTRFWR